MPPVHGRWTGSQASCRCMASNFSAPKGIAALSSTNMTGPMRARLVFDWRPVGGSKGLGSPSLPPAPAQAACPPFQGWDCKPWPPYQTFPPHHTLIAIAREHFPWSRSSAVHPLALPPAPFVFPPACNQTKSCTRLNCICIHIHSIELYYLATHALSRPS